MQASRGSMGRKGPARAVMPSIIREETNMAYRLVTSRWPPMNRQPSRNRGMFSRITTVPMGAQGRAEWMI